MKILFFDLETTGLPSPEAQKGTVSENFNQWPRIWQIAWLFEDTEDRYNNLTQCLYLQCPDGDWVADDGNPVAVDYQKRCKSMGVGQYAAFHALCDLMHETDLIVCHNVAFDSRVFESECYRLRETDPDFPLPPKKSEGKPKICTMVSSTKHCAIPKKGGKGIKWPTLQELHEVLFKEKYKDAHDALADVRATARCFWELVRFGVIGLDKSPNSEPNQ